MRTLTEKPGCLWPGLYRRGVPPNLIVRPRLRTGLPHTSQRSGFSWKTQSWMSLHKRRFQRNVRKINVKLKVGNPCPRPCTPVNQVGSGCRIGCHEHDYVNLKLIHIIIHLEIYIFETSLGRSIGWPFHSIWLGSAQPRPVSPVHSSHIFLRKQLDPISIKTL